MIAINHNIAANNTASNLTRNYQKLAVSTQRLSSGLRINGASDDAAGLAIRELQRAEIAALHQGARNVNDALSMVQTFDGALGIIDEKLIRMKELAEQAATGTYDSTQRMMINDEFIAMGAEIDRIARSTDFNGIKLIDGNFKAPAVAGAQGGVVYTHSISSTFVRANTGTVTETGSDTLSWDPDPNASTITDPASLITDAAAGTGNYNIKIKNNAVVKFGDKYLLTTPVTNTKPPNGTKLELAYDKTNNDWTVIVNGTQDNTAMGNTKRVMFEVDGLPYILEVFEPGGGAGTLDSSVPLTNWTVPADDTTYTVEGGPPGTTAEGKMAGNKLTMKIDLGGKGKNIITHEYEINGGNATAIGEINVNVNVTDPSKKPADEIPDNVVKIHFGPMNDSAEDYYYVNKHDATLKGLGLNGTDVQTQTNAQNALVTVQKAVIAKDRIRAEYGAMQNRLSNTLANLTTQAEQLQIAESRISDADIAQEMTMFTRNQVLTQSAVAMMAQANLMPQVVMRLIGG